MHSGEWLWVQFSPLNYSTTFCSCLFVSLIQMVENVITFPVFHVSAGWLNKKLWITRTPAAPLCDIYAAAVFSERFFFFLCRALQRVLVEVGALFIRGTQTSRWNGLIQKLPAHFLGLEYSWRCRKTPTVVQTQVTISIHSSTRQRCGPCCLGASKGQRLICKDVFNEARCRGYFQTLNSQKAWTMLLKTRHNDK